MVRDDHKYVNPADNRLLWRLLHASKSYKNGTWKLGTQYGGLSGRST